MIAGLLSDFVSLYRPEVSVDKFGATTTGYTLYGRVRAQVSWKSGTLSVQASEMFGDERLELLVRDSHPLEEKWLVEVRGSRYRVAAVDLNRRRGYRKAFLEKLND